MRILHYALGFPPYRSGGLTKWCVDLMVQQAKEGHEVAMLWPGKMGIATKKAAGVFARLLAACDRLRRVVMHNEGGANKDLARFADQINSLCDKWDR